jgi:ABC-type multidrug transport system fused ATPase/permease subunit
VRVGDPEATDDDVRAGKGDSLAACRLSSRTVVVITHRPVGLDRMDEIVVLHKGRIQARGTHEELLDVSPRYRGMWTLAGRHET